MPQFLRLLLSALLLSTLLLATSCGSKTKDPQGPTQPQTAKLSGQLTAGAVTKVTATDGAGKASTATPTATGDFSFADLPVGAYTLTYAVADEYIVPAPQTVTLPVGGLVLPLLTVALPAPSFTYILDGKFVTVGVNDGYASNSLTGYVVLSFAIGAKERTAIFVKAPLTLGQRDLKTFTEWVDYTDPNGVRYTTDPGRSLVSSSGVLDINKLNPNTHRASGSFNFVAGRSNGSGTSADPSSHTVLNGTFTGLPYNP